MGKIGEVRQVPIAELVPYERNARIHSEEQVEQIAASIREFGFVSPVLIDERKNVIAGHGRIMAAKKIGMEAVPCVFVEGLTDEQRRAYIIADNRLTELGGWDMGIIEQELAELGSEGFDVTLTGFDWDRAATLETITDGDYDPAGDRAATLETITEPGDLWLLGEHRLLCGDATSAEDMGRLFVEPAALVVTDPPYGVAIGSKNKIINEIAPGKGGRVEEDIEGDTESEEELYKILVRAMTLLRENAKPDASFYVFSPQGGGLGLMMMMMMKDAGLPVRHLLMWIKSSPTFSMGRLDYSYRHEPIMYTWAERHNFFGGYDQTIIDENKRLEDMSKPELKDLVHALKGDGATTAIYCDKPTQSKLHPTMKPAKLIARFIYNSSREGDVVADIFGGSGTTMIAAEQLGRRCFMMEKDPHYCDVIVDRWEQLTGKKAERQGGGVNG